MSLVLRGHHLLCIHGFRGMGYSPGFVEEMQKIVELMRDEKKDFPIRVVADLDHACSACPNKGSIICEASADSNEHVITMDQKVIHQLGLVEGEAYKKSHLIQLTAEKVTPSDLDYICKGCSWLSYGVCKEGITALKAQNSPSTALD